MKATLIILTILTSALAASAQQPVTATTEDGRKVLLYPVANGAYCGRTGPQSRSFRLSRGRSGPHLRIHNKINTIGSGQGGYSIPARRAISRLGYS